MAGVVGNLATEDPLLRDQYAHAPTRRKAVAIPGKKAPPFVKGKGKVKAKTKGKAGKKGKPFAKKKAPAAPPRPSPIASAMGVDAPDATY